MTGGTRPAAADLMILGYRDKEERAYDLNFATLRMKIRIDTPPSGESVILFAPSTGSGGLASRVLGEAQVTASVGMDHGGHVVPLLRSVEGRLLRHERGLLFLAEPRARDPEDPSFFLVKLRALPSAVQFFFEDQEGSEIVSVPAEEVLRVDARQDRTVVVVTAAGLALPKEALAYVLEFVPASRAMPLLQGFPMSAGS